MKRLLNKDLKWRSELCIWWWKIIQRGHRKCKGPKARTIEWIQGESEGPEWLKWAAWKEKSREVQYKTIKKAVPCKGLYEDSGFYSGWGRKPSQNFQQRGGTIWQHLTRSLWLPYWEQTSKVGIERGQDIATRPARGLRQWEVVAACRSMVTA